MGCFSLGLIMKEQPTSVWLGEITAEQARTLEITFAVLTEDGWTVPDWLIHLQQQIAARDAQRAKKLKPS